MVIALEQIELLHTLYSCWLFYFSVLAENVRMLLACC